MKKRAGAAPPCIWLLMSHRTGDNTQLRALAEALGLPFEVKEFAYRPGEWLARIVPRRTQKSNCTLNLKKRAKVDHP